MMRLHVEHLCNFFSPIHNSCFLSLEKCRMGYSVRWMCLSGIGTMYVCMRLSFSMSSTGTTLYPVCVPCPSAA